jgi:hypothetical protein
VTNPTNEQTIQFTVGFNEWVTGVDGNDFALTTTGVVGAHIVSVEGSVGLYTVTVDTGSGNGTIRLDVPSGASITDKATNPIAGLPYTSGQVYTIQKASEATDTPVPTSTDTPVPTSTDTPVPTSTDTPTPTETMTPTPTETPTPTTTVIIIPDPTPDLYPYHLYLPLIVKNIDGARSSALPPSSTPAGNGGGGAGLLSVLSSLAYVLWKFLRAQG